MAPLRCIVPYTAIRAEGVQTGPYLRFPDLDIQMLVPFLQPLVRPWFRGQRSVVGGDDGTSKVTSIARSHSGPHRCIVCLFLEHHTSLVPELAAVQGLDEITSYKAMLLSA